MRGSQPHPALWSSTSLPRSRPVFGVCNIEKEHSDSTTEFSIKP
jgi:hypothetical protein